MRFNVIVAKALKSTINFDFTGRSSKAKLLTWEDRLRIAFDAAQG